MVFIADDITEGTQIAGTTNHAFGVRHRRDDVGTVVIHAVALVNAGTDPREYIASRLNDYELDHGGDKLRTALAAGLELA